jgi:hypothetical protein
LILFLLAPPPPQSKVEESKKDVCWDTNYIKKKSQSQCFRREKNQQICFSSRKCKKKKSNSNKNLQKQCIILNRSSLQFSNRRY